MVSVGVILAAGGSRRMGVPKALLPVQGVALVRRHEVRLRPHCHQVCVVLGGWGEAIASALSHRARPIHNPRWEETGPAESLLLAVADLHAEARVLVTPVDVPPAPHDALLDLVGRTPLGMHAVVGHSGQPGHPVLVTAGAIQDIIGQGGTLRDVVGSQPRLVEARTADVLRNLNTPGEWAAWTGAPPPDRLPHVHPEVAALCPRCAAPVSRGELTDLLRPLLAPDAAALQRAVADVLQDESEEARWACARCIEAGQAIPATLSRQLEPFGLPWYLYVDRDLVCADCHQPFVFTGREQQLWFEQYGIRIYGGPRSPYCCLVCRRLRKQGRQEQRQLTAHLAQLDPRDPGQLREVAVLYRAIGAHQKAETFLRRARNRARDTTEHAELDALLQQWLAEDATAS